MNAPTTKFQRPSVEDNHILFRPRLMERLAKRGMSRRVIAFEGQAGQGKSILASQYLDHLDTAYSWCTLGEEESYVTGMLASLNRACEANLQGYSCPVLAELSLEQGEGADDEASLLAAFLQALDECGGIDTYLVLDGLQALEHAPEVLDLLQQLIAQAPGQVHFLITSRVPTSVLLQDIHSTQSWFVIDNALLAFSEDEVVALLSQGHSDRVSRERAGDLFQRTLGWSMGLTYLSANRNEDARALEKDLDDYFQRHLLDTLSTDVRDFLIRIALLESISLQLALTVSGREEAASLLQGMIEHHDFIYQRPGETVYEMHPLLREVLRRRAESYLGRATLQEILKRVMERLIDQQQPQHAVVYALKAGDLQSVEQLLRQMGGGMLEILRHIEPKEVIETLTQGKATSAWLMLLQAAAALEYRPAMAQAPLYLALEKFSQGEDALGELLAHALSLVFDTLVSGNIDRVHSLYPRAAELYEGLRGKLDVYTEACVSACLGGAQLILHDNAELGRNSLEYGLRLASEHRHQGLALRVRLMRLFDLISSGQLLEAKGDMEALHSIINETWYGKLEKGYIYAAMAYWLYRAGELKELKRHLRLARVYLPRSIMEETLAGVMLSCWEIQLALSEGDFLTAQHLLKQALSLQACSGHAIMVNYLRPYQPLFDMLLGQFGAPHKKALAQIADMARSDMYGLHGYLVLGSAYAQLGEDEQALAFLDEAYKRAEAYGDHFSLAGVLMQRAALHYKLQNKKAAEADSSAFFQQLQEHGGRYCELWLPKVATDFCAAGVKAGYEERYMRQLAADCLDLGFGEKAETLPMVHVRSLGEMGMEVGGEMRLSQQNLTPSQRSLLALLIITPDLCLDQASVQLVLWPDSPQEKARANFDALLSRVRSTLNKALTPWKAKPYFVLKRGVLCLTNCVVDLHSFRSQGEDGLRLYKEGKHWEAGLRLRKAVEYWRGMLCPKEHSLPVIDDLREQLNEQYSQCSRVLAGLVEQEGEYQEAVGLLQQFFHADPADEALVRKLYNLYKQLGQRDLAAQVLNTYHNALIEAGTSAEDTIAMVVKTSSGRKYTFD